MSARRIAYLRLKLNHRKKRVRQRAAEELIKFGKAAIPALMEALTDEKKRVRFWAAWALVTIGKEEAKVAVPVLMEAQKLVEAMQRREKRRKLVLKILAIALLIIGGLAGIGGMVLIATAIKIDDADFVLIGVILFPLGLVSVFAYSVIHFISDSIQPVSMATSKGYQMKALPIDTEVRGPLLEKTLEKERKGMLGKESFGFFARFLVIYFPFIGAATLTFGILFLSFKDLTGIAPICTALMAFLGWIPFLRIEIIYRRFKSLRKQKDIPLLLEKVEKEGSLKQHFAIAALGDLQAEAAVQALINFIKKSAKKEEIVETAKEALDSIAQKLGYDTREPLLQVFGEGEPLEETFDIPPPKVYQLEKLPIGTRCMVSHLEIHLEMDELVACPYCEEIAKKELLEEWLEENHTCPVCQRILRIEECPKVVLKGRS